MERKAYALASRMDDDKAITLSKRIFDFLVKKGQNVYIETRLAPKIFPLNGMDLISMTNDNIEVIIAVGGDGTLLRVAGNISQRDPPPILGVNIDSIGFLDESSERSIFKDLNQILEGQYVVEKCCKLTPYVSTSKNDTIKLNNALNEVLIVSSKSSKVLQISVYINGAFLNRSYLDGVIVSTPIGSTAYNLSAGGAIVNPSLETIQLTPLNPFARSGLKPIVLPIDSEIEIRLLRPRLNAKIIIDGQTTIKKVQPNTRIRIRRANSHAKFVRLSTKNLHENYFRRLRKKIIGTVRIPFDDSPEE